MSQQQWDQLRATILAGSQAQVDAALRACDDVGDEILAESKKLCPVSPSNEFIDGAVGDDGKVLKGKKRPRNPNYNGHPGKLRDSGTTDPAEVAQGTIVKRIKYTAEYAAPVHERTGVLHGAAFAARNPSSKVPNLQGQAKFLAVPMLRRRRSAVAAIAAAVGAVARG